MIRTCLVLVAAIVTISTRTVSVGAAGVDLVLKPTFQVVQVGESVDLGLYALSSNESDWPISGMDVVVLYDPTRLHFYNLTSMGAPYNWLQNGFFWPSPDNINDDLSDGQMMYTAWAQLGVPAVAPGNGLLVTTFQFQAQAEGCGEYVAVVPAWGTSATTRVFDGTTPNHDVTGNLGAAKILVVSPGVHTSVAQAKFLPDESAVQIGGPIVTRTYGTYFYIENLDRAAGIRVNSTQPLPAPGTVALVSGIVRTINGERVIDDAIVVVKCPVGVPGALAMTCNSATSGLSPVGLLVKIAGRVASVSPSEDMFILADGSKQDVRVELHGVAPPQVGDFVAVVGALGSDTSGPIVRISDPVDMQLYP